MSIEYNGRPNFARPRKLTDLGTIEHFKDNLDYDAFGNEDEREQLIDQIFTDLAKTYLKGNKLKEGLSKMDPAQYIPIEEACDSTRAAAIRLNKEESKEGSIITYSLYQKAVDIILAKKWEIRGTAIKMKLPASVAQTTQETTEKISNSPKPESMLKEFVSQNGIISTILGMLTISPFQTIIFQALGVEQGAKGIQISQIPAGIALFLELGIKAERIINALKKSNISTPLVEKQIEELSSSDTARAAALKTIGLDYDELKKSKEFIDSEEIIKYVNEYYRRYGGLVGPNSHLSIDHWIAYLNVAQNQQTIRGALNTSSEFSPKFQSYKQQYSPSQNTPEEGASIFNQPRKTSKMFIQLASATRSLKENSNNLYDDILSSFIYQLTDRDMCCLVQIFGAIGNPEVMYTIASLLRILATDLSGEIVRIQNIISSFLANLAQDALFEIAKDINKFYYKIADKITKTFTTDFENLPACNGMLTLGWALLHSVRAIFDQVNALIRDISTIIGNFGLASDGSWKIAADRRHLLGIARILEVLAARLDLANTCELDSKNRSVRPNNDLTDTDSNFDQAIFTILGDIPPVLPMKSEDVQKHFPDITTKQSSRLKFSYGIIPEQNTEKGKGNCYTPDQQERINNLINSLTSALRENLNG